MKIINYSIFVKDNETLIQNALKGDINAKLKINAIKKIKINLDNVLHII
jgi:predicted transcriptional regulator